ncbi:MAG: MerR family transcriptional regulator [Desulfuromusa sp.]|nr:MerR family transcriptional regulator [Desulfuromusa sp.]
MRIKALVEKSGVPRTTIHFYLRHGLLPPPHKTGRTMAYYDDSHLHRLQTIERLKKGSRMPIALLKGQLDLLENGAPGKAAPYDVTETVATTKEKKLKRKEIVKQAIAVFSQKGYHRTKIVDITRSLQISTGTFYLYFENKRDLFMEVIDDVFRNIVGEAAIAIKNEEDFLERCKIRGRVFYENYAKYSEILSQLRAELASDEQWPEKKIKKIYHGLTKPVIREFEIAVRNGTIRKIDSDLLAYGLTGMLEIMTLRSSLDKKYNVENIIEFIVDLTLKPLLMEKTTES